MEHRLVTHVPPDKVLEKAERYFALDWRYGGGYTRHGATAKVVKEAGLLRTFFAVFGIGSEIDVGQITAFPEDGGSLVVVSSNRGDWGKALRLWAETQLGGEEASAN
jgi:hypothetical protein